MRTPLVPRGATARKPSLRNIRGVPNQRHSGTAAIFGEATGYASTTPPPLFPIESSAARRANFATPRPRYFGSTKKHVILHNFLTPTRGATLRQVRRASILGSSSWPPYWHQPIGVRPSYTRIAWERPLRTNALLSDRFLRFHSSLVAPGRR